MNPDDRRPARTASLISLFALIAIAVPVHAFDTYDTSTGRLLAQSVKVGDATYTDVVVNVSLADIVVPPSGTSGAATTDSYSPLDNQLTIPTVAVGPKIYYNVVVKVGGLVSIGNVTGVDTYNTTTAQLTIPLVYVGEAVYTNVVITVGSIVSTGGGLPRNTGDIYDPATGELTMEAVRLGTRVFTNPVIRPGNILSIGGQLPGESVLYSLSALSINDSTDAGVPAAGLIQGIDGNLYGTSTLGGAYSSGSVFRVTPQGTESVVYSFGAGGATDGLTPDAALIQDSAGNLYGTTSGGGTYGTGTVFKLTPAGTLSLLYSFTGNGGVANSNDGAYPNGGLIFGTDGNLYGTTTSGGAYNDGIVFSVTPAGQETIVYAFGSTANDGIGPVAGLAQDSAGNFYGTTQYGGTNSGGTVFEISPSGEKVLYSFGARVSDAASPLAPLTYGADGNLYGTTLLGGVYGAGTVFRVTPGGTETVLHSFSGGTPGSIDGASPYGGLTQASDGNFYGTTQAGGTYGAGSVFRVTPAGAEKVLYSFSGNGTVDGSNDGAYPQAAPIQASDGNFYGTTSAGGSSDQGTVYRLTRVLTAH